MRTMTLLLCLSFAGCASAPSDVVLEPTPAAAAPAAQPATPARTAAVSARPKPDNSKDSGKKDDKKEAWWKEGGVTREKINGMCWMKYEQGRKDLPVEKRADLVNQCVTDTLKEHPL